MATTLQEEKSADRLKTLHLDAQLRLIRAVKARMQAKGEKITAAILRKKGYSEPFIKRFLSA